MIIRFEASLLHELLKISNADGILINSSGKMISIYKKKNDKDIRIERFFKPIVEEEGYTIISKEIINLLPKNEEVILTNNTIECGKRNIEFTPFECKLRTIDIINNKVAELDKNIMDFLLEVDYAIAKDETRPILCGIHFKNNEVCALEGSRLSLRKSNKLYIDSEFTIPMEFIKKFKKIKYKGNVVISCNNNYIKFQCGDYIIIGKLLEGKYINYNQLISTEYKTKVKLNKEEIIKILDCFKSYNKDMELIKLNIKENNINIIADFYDNNGKKVTIIDNINCNTKGEELEIGFNYKYLKEALIDKENVVLEFFNEVSPVIIKEEINIGEKLELVLPIRYWQ